MNTITQIPAWEIIRLIARARANFVQTVWKELKRQSGKQPSENEESYIRQAAENFVGRTSVTGEAIEAGEYSRSCSIVFLGEAHKQLAYFVPSKLLLRDVVINDQEKGNLHEGYLVTVTVPEGTDIIEFDGRNEPLCLKGTVSAVFGTCLHGEDGFIVSSFKHTT
ncbi:MAG: hypothetical protein Q8L64_03705 [bacterium]|nr:hypothetical protein [bacterium]